MPSVNIEDTTSEPQLAAVRTPLQTSDRVFITINDITYRGTLANLLAFITTNFDLSAYVTTASIINVLTSTSDTVPASAGTVKALKDLIDTINTSLSDKCPLVDGLVPSANLPSFVDDALEFANLAAFPVTGEGGKIYIAANTNLIYRWTGSTYVLIGDGTSVDVVGVGASSFVRYDVAQTLSNDDKAQLLTNIGACPLVEGKVPSENLPSYVDDALEFANLAAFPVTGEGGIIYLAIDTNLIYRWTGSTYVLIGDGTSVDVVAAGSAAFPRYDQAQTLTDANKSQLLTNIGAKKSYNRIPDKTAAYTLALSDFKDAIDLYDKVYLRMNMATSISNTVTVGTALSSLPNLAEISIRNAGAGFTTIVADGTTLNGILVFTTVNEVKTLIKVGANEWDVVGVLS